VFYTTPLSWGYIVLLVVPELESITINLLLCYTTNLNNFPDRTDERESSQEAKPARENSSLGFIEAVHQ